MEQDNYYGIPIEAFDSRMMPQKNIGLSPIEETMYPQKSVIPKRENMFPMSSGIMPSPKEIKPMPKPTPMPMPKPIPTPMPKLEPIIPMPIPIPIPMPMPMPTPIEMDITMDFDTSIEMDMPMKMKTCMPKNEMEHCDEKHMHKGDMEHCDEMHMSRGEMEHYNERKMNTCMPMTMSKNGMASCDEKCHSKLSLAMAFVPNQQIEQVYKPEEGLKNGTMFPDLNLPYYGKGGY
jgi:hypothetical protein